MPAGGTAVLPWMPVPYLAFGRSDADRLVEQLLRHPPVGLRDAFCAGVAAGLPLRVPVDAMYIGSASGGGRGGDVGHMFRASPGSRPWQVRVPASAEPLVSAGGELAAGQPWCRLVPWPPAAWARRRAPERWRTLADALPGHVSRPALLRLWLEHHIVARRELRLLPAWLVGPLASSTSPSGLWWDIAPASAHLDGILEAAVLPPIRTAAWYALRVCLGGEVDLDAGVGDPRFCASSAGAEPRKLAPKRMPNTNGAARSAA
jgi:hypothetical protein